MAIDILGTIAARLKRDAVFFSRDKFWILQELGSKNGTEESYPKDVCSICLEGRVERLLLICQDCQRMFHADCMGVKEHEVSNRAWYCHICLCRKQLLVLQSYCKSQCKDDGKKDKTRAEKKSESTFSISEVEIIQQLLLNYLQECSSADDVHLFVRWCVIIDFPY